MSDFAVPSGRRRGRHPAGWHFMAGRRGGGRGRHGLRGAGMHGFLGGGSRARRGDIRSAVLALLSEKPMHGYQIMSELSERTGGVWRPSPGSVYPTLQQLQDEGLVRELEPDGGRHTFELTEEGRQAASALGATPPWEAVAAQSEDAAVELRELVFQVMTAARQVVQAGETAQLAQAKEVLREARQRLYGILADDGAPTD